MDETLTTLVEENQNLWGVDRQPAGCPDCERVFLSNQAKWVLSAPFAAVDDSLHSRFASARANQRNGCLLTSSWKAWPASIKIAFPACGSSPKTSNQQI